VLVDLNLIVPLALGKRFPVPGPDACFAIRVHFGPSKNKNATDVETGGAWFNSNYRPAMCCGKAAALLPKLLAQSEDRLQRKEKGAGWRPACSWGFVLLNANQGGLPLHLSANPTEADQAHAEEHRGHTAIRQR